MQSQIKLSAAIQKLLCCPVCKSKIELIGNQFRCAKAECDASFPIVNGVPVLLNESSSLFSIADFVQQRYTFFDLSPENKLKKTLKQLRLVPGIGLSTKSKPNYDKFARLLLDHSPTPRVLVVGGSILGYGMEPLLACPSIELVEGDISFGPQTMLIYDAHDIPFENDSFDGVIAQAVFEHVVDPYRCVDEIHRVLKKDGLVYAETPFIQQIHGGQYDFTRFTQLGHRRLFRKFAEIDSGALCGPGMALAWSYQYFLLSFVKTKTARTWVRIAAILTSFWLKYFDYYLIDKPGTLDAASAYFFIGKKSNQRLSDRDLIKLYSRPWLAS